MILILALVVLGPEKLPNAVRQFTKTYAELKKMSNGFQSELKSALDEPMREMRETANMVRDAADPTKILDEAEAEQRLEHTRVMEEASPVTTPVPSTHRDTVRRGPGPPVESPATSSTVPAASTVHLLHHRRCRSAAATAAASTATAAATSAAASTRTPDSATVHNPVGSSTVEGPVA